MAMEYVFDFPVYRLLNHVPATQKMNASFLNRGMIVLALTLFAATGAAMRAEKNKWIWAGACIAAFMLAAFQSDSQSAQLGLLAALLAMTMFPLQQRWAWRVLPVLIALLLFSLPWIAHWAFMYADDVDASSWMGKGGAYGAQRLEIWHFIAQAIFAHPWLGYGTEAARVMTFDSQMRFFDSNTVLHPHNFGMQIWLEFGALGIALACVMFAWIVRMIAHAPMPQRRFILAGFVAAFAVASTAYGMWQGWWVGLLTLVVVYMVMMVRAGDQQP
jgi:O-antigen ligase